MNKTSLKVQRSNNPVMELTRSYKKAHREYLRAQIDYIFKDELLPQLQFALNEYERVEAGIYDKTPEENLENLLLRLKSINIILEGYFWIGAIEKGKELLGNYSDVEMWIKNIEQGIKNETYKKLGEVWLELSALSCLQHAKSVILCRTSLKHKHRYLDDKRRVICEVIRIGVNIATIIYYTKHRYPEAIALLESCETLINFIVNQPSSGDIYRGKLYGLRAQVLYFSGCCYRQINYLRKAEELFMLCLALYVERINEKYNYYIQDREKPNWVRFHLSAGISRYRTAIILAARADLNYRKGLRMIALHQNLGVAQIILGESADVINRAYVRMQSAIISRELAEEEALIKSALLDIKQSESDFIKMGHQKYANRAIYERAYTLFYLVRFYQREKPADQERTRGIIDEALQILANLKEKADPRWKAQYLILESRLLVLKQDPENSTRYYKESEKCADAAIQLLKGEPNHVTYLIEALIAKSRALMERFTHSKSGQSALLEEADKLLQQAWIANNQNIGDLAPSNHKIEAIIHFARVRVKLRMGQLEAAREQLREGNRFAPNIESKGVYELRRYAEQELKGLGKVFLIPHGNALDENKKALEKYLIEQAEIEATQSPQKVWEILNISKSSYYEKKKSLEEVVEKKIQTLKKSLRLKSTKAQSSKKIKSRNRIQSSNLINKKTVSF